MIRVLALFATAVTLAACGQKGLLRLPQAEAKATPASAVSPVTPVTPVAPTPPAGPPSSP